MFQITISRPIIILKIRIYFFRVINLPSPFKKINGRTMFKVVKLIIHSHLNETRHENNCEKTRNLILFATSLKLFFFLKKIKRRKEKG